MAEKEKEKKYEANENFTKFLEEELERLEEVKKQKLAAKDMRPWASLKVGENVVEFLPVPPRPHPVFSGRVIFRVKQGGEERDLAISTGGRLYREILTALKQGRFKLKIIRVGTGKTDTRYTLQEA